MSNLNLSNFNFERWVFDDILPTINHTGGYVQHGKEEKFINNYFSNLSWQTKKMIIRDLERKNCEFTDKILSNNKVLTKLKKDMVKYE